MLPSAVQLIIYMIEYVPLHAKSINASLTIIFDRGAIVCSELGATDKLSIECLIQPSIGRNIRTAPAPAFLGHHICPKRHIYKS